MHYQLKQFTDSALSVLNETDKEHHTFIFLKQMREGNQPPVMWLIPQKHSLVFMKCFFLALRENKKVQIF